MAAKCKSDFETLRVSLRCLLGYCLLSFLIITQSSDVVFAGPLYRARWRFCWDAIRRWKFFGVWPSGWALLSCLRCGVENPIICLFLLVGSLAGIRSVFLSNWYLASFAIERMCHLFDLLFGYRRIMLLILGLTLLSKKFLSHTSVLRKGLLL